MNYLLVMQIPDSDDHLDCIESDYVFVENLLFLEDFIQFGTSDERHHEVEPEVILEQIIHSDKEWMVDFK